MNKTILGDKKFYEDEYSIAITASENMQHIIAALQSRLTALLGDSVWLMPIHSLHITVMELLCGYEYKENSRKELFKHKEIMYRNTPRTVIGKYKSSALYFNKLVASPQAIIVKTNNSSFLNSIRGDLLKAIDLPQETKAPPDITHCTIARFAEEVDLKEVQEKINSIRVDFEEAIKDIKLVKDMSPPNFDYTTLETFLLG